MDPPPITPLPAANAAAADYLDSSPRSPASADGSADQPLPPKLRLMCSYGGHIIPRPHDKSLCYVGGDTRMVVVDRNASLGELSARLSQSLLNGRPFTLKYQLPSEDLDSLITVSTDEDLENMIEEYDRNASVSPLKPSRLRLFLFVNVPETTMSMGNLLEDAKSETWFMDALNNAMLLPRGLSDSATAGCVLNLDRVASSDSCTNLEAQEKTVQDVHSMPGSPMVENSSSYGSPSSSPSMSNLPRIRVRVVNQDTEARGQDQRAGIEKQFAPISVAPPPTINVTGILGVASAALTVNQMAAPGENVNRGMSDDERSEQGVPLAFQKPTLPMQVQPVQQKAAALYNLPSPDSVASDSCIASVRSLSRPIAFEDQAHAHRMDQSQRVPVSPTSEEALSDLILSLQIPQPQEPAYTIAPQLDQQPQQQQYMQMRTHYIPHHATNPALIPSYYHHPIHAAQSQQQLHHHSPMNQQQQPVYVMPVPQNQPYNMSVQPSLADNNSVLVSSRPPSSTIPSVVQPHGYTDTNMVPPSIYPMKATAQMKPEMASTSMYSSYITPAPPPLLTVQSNQYQQQHLGVSPQPQSVAVASSMAPNYAFDYSHAGHDWAYYAQHPLPPQYQTMTAATAVALSDASKQLPADTSKQQSTAPQLPF